MSIEIKNIAKAAGNIGMKVINATIIHHPILTVTAVIGGIAVYKAVKAVNSFKRTIKDTCDNLDWDEVMKAAEAMASAAEKMAENHEEVFEEVEKAVEETFDDEFTEKIEKAAEEVFENAEKAVETSDEVVEGTEEVLGEDLIRTASMEEFSRQNMAAMQNPQTNLQ